MGLEVRNLSCTRAGHLVLRDLGFTIADGEAMLLRGPNGVGKSTLLRALAGILPSTSEIVLDGDPLAGDAFAERVAYAGHLDAIKLQLTVAENLRFWNALYGGSGPAAALDAFDLAGIASRPAHACSAGQKRRLGLARLMLVRRRLWLLDEPTASLDARNADRLCAAVDAHCAAGGLALIATHTALALSRARDMTLAPLATAAAAGTCDPFLGGGWT